MEQVNLTRVRKRVSWGSIFAGVVTVLAISVLISMLVTSIGLFQFDPLSDDPTAGIGATVGIGTVISMIVSFIIGGFVAGKLAGADGVIHGLVVWAVTSIVAVLMALFLAVGAVKVTANVLGSVSSVAGSVLSDVGSMAGKGISNLAGEAKDLFGDIDIDTNIKGDSIRKDVRRALQKSGIKELNPDYLGNQLKAVKGDLKRTVKQVAANPDRADDLINGFTNRLKTRANTITKNIDRNDVSTAIANNTNLSKAEADKAVDQYMNLIETATDKAKEQINNLEETLEKAKQEWQEIKHKALLEAEKASNAAARSALISFFGLLVAAILCCWAGFFGTRKTKEGYEV